MARREGFTLIELLVVAAIMGIAVIYMFESITAGNRAYTVLDQVAETQQSVRAVADLIERDIRHAGMMVPQGAAVCGVDNTTDPDVLYVSDAEAIDPGADIMPYEGAPVTGAAVNVSGSNVTLVLDSLLLEPSPPRAAYDTNGDGTSDSDFRVGGGVIVIDLNDPSRGTVCGTIQAINLGSSSITIDPVRAEPLGAASGTVKLVAVPAHEYRISNGDELRRDGLLLAKGVEDLQLAYFLDADGDNEIDDLPAPGEMRGTEAGTNDYVAQGTDMSDLREVRMNLVVRTRMEDERFTGRPQAKENRATGGDDGFRRRAYTSTIMLRNMFSRIGT